MVAKIERTPEAEQDVKSWLRERQQEARELCRQNPNALEELDTLIQRILDPDVVFELRTADEFAEDEDRGLDG